MLQHHHMWPSKEVSLSHSVVGSNNPPSRRLALRTSMLILKAQTRTVGHRDVSLVDDRIVGFVRPSHPVEERLVIGLVILARQKLVAGGGGMGTGKQRDGAVCDYGWHDATPCCAAQIEQFLGLENAAELARSGCAMEIACFSNRSLKPSHR